MWVVSIPVANEARAPSQRLLRHPPNDSAATISPASADDSLDYQLKADN
jgi:hypothetical protein